MRGILINSIVITCSPRPLLPSTLPCSIMKKSQIYPWRWLHWRVNRPTLLVRSLIKCLWKWWCQAGWRVTVPVCSWVVRLRLKFERQIIFCNSFSEDAFRERALNVRTDDTTRTSTSLCSTVSYTDDKPNAVLNSKIHYPRSDCPLRTVSIKPRHGQMQM